jgi:hypothetical protein
MYMSILLDEKISLSPTDQKIYLVATEKIRKASRGFEQLYSKNSFADYLVTVELLREALTSLKLLYVEERICFTTEGRHYFFTASKHASNALIILVRKSKTQK